LTGLAFGFEEDLLGGDGAGEAAFPSSVIVDRSFSSTLLASVAILSVKQLNLFLSSFSLLKF
jgi:hypothetical protein